MALTPAGSEVVEDALKAYLDESEEVLEVLSDEERDTLAELLRKLLVGLEGPKSTEPEPEDRRARARAGRPLKRFE